MSRSLRIASRLPATRANLARRIVRPPPSRLRIKLLTILAFSLPACHAPQMGRYASEAVKSTFIPSADEMARQIIAQESLSCSPSKHNMDLGDAINHAWATSVMFVTSTLSLVIHAPGELLDRLIPDAKPEK